MCTLILLQRPDHDWPLLLAANRDEMTDRPWLAPDHHWPGQPHVVAGIDRLGGGSWLGLNSDGLVAAIMNRHGTLGPQAGMHSRGKLVLRALEHDSSAVAAAALAQLDPALYRSFNLVVADRREAFWLCHHGEAKSGRIVVHTIPPGLAMLTAGNLNDMRSPRIRTWLAHFREASPPDPESGDGWSEWAALLASRSFNPMDGVESAMTVVTNHGYGTVSSSLVALPTLQRTDLQPVWLFAAGRPDLMAYESISL